MLACTLLVPIAIPPHNLQQLLQRLCPVVFRIEGESQIVPSLMVVSINSSLRVAPRDLRR